MARNCTEGQVVWVSVGHDFFDYCNVGIVIWKQCHLHVLKKSNCSVLDVNVHVVLLHFCSRNSVKHPTDLWCSL